MPSSVYKNVVNQGERYATAHVRAGGGDSVNHNWFRYSLMFIIIFALYWLLILYLTIPDLDSVMALQTDLTSDEELSTTIDLSDAQVEGAIYNYRPQ